MKKKRKPIPTEVDPRYERFIGIRSKKEELEHLKRIIEYDKKHRL